MKKGDLKKIKEFYIDNNLIDKEINKNFEKDIEKQLKKSIKKSKNSIKKNQSHFTRDMDYDKLFKNYSKLNLKLT